MTEDTYRIVSLIISIAGFVFTIGSLLVVGLTLRQGTKTREVDVLLTLFSMSTTQAFRNDLDVVRTLAPQQELSDDQRRACGRVSVFFEILGAVVRGGYMGSALIEETYGALITSMYDKLRWFIDARRKREYGSMFAANFEFLAEKIRRKVRVSRAPGESAHKERF